MTGNELNELGAEVLDSCFEVHRHLGPGLLESAYIFALLKEFEFSEINASSKFAIPLYYIGYDIGKRYEIDILVENEIVIEAKQLMMLCIRYLKRR